MTTSTRQVDDKYYRILVETVKDYAIFMLDKDGNVTSWNEGAEKIKGYKQAEIIGKNNSVFYVQEDINNRVPQTNLQKAAEQGRFECEGWRLRKDGSTFWASIVLTALKDDKGKLFGFAKLTRDASAWKKTEEKITYLNGELTRMLKQSKTETDDYKHALDEAAIVAITDQKGIIKHVNENFCKISKYSKEELIGRDHEIINSGYHPKAFIRDLWVTIANGIIWKGEIKNKAKDGSFYWVDTTIVPFVSEDGKPYQYLAIRSDITQRKLFEEQLISLNTELEKKIADRTLELTAALETAKDLNEIKTRFVSLASHEFRTPLSAILSSLYLINHYIAPEHEEKRNKHIERIKSSVQNLTNILDDFLSLEKLEQGKVQTASISFNLREFIEDIIEEMDGIANKKNHLVNLACKDGIEVHQDKKILRNVLINLLSNAMKYSDEGKRIDVKGGLKGSTIFISVKDEGIGIPAEAQKELFGIFFRAQNAASIQGTGLGLNIVKKYSELLGGGIRFNSKENKGSTFTVEFPQYK